MGSVYLRAMVGPALRLLDPILDPLPVRLSPGRIVELSGATGGGFGTARTTTAVSIVRHAQADGETAAWVMPRDAPLYPPDLQEAGVDLDALVVVHVPMAALPYGPCRAAELLLRSGAFGLVLVDLGGLTLPAATLSAWLGRVLGLARQHESRVVLLTEKPTHADSLGTLVGVRIESHLHRAAEIPGHDVPLVPLFTVEHQVIKNKSGAPFDVAHDLRRAPDGIGR